MGYAIRLAGTVGQYLVAVEQHGPGRGRRLVVTDDPDRARRWADPTAARRFWADSGLPADVPIEIDLLPEIGGEVCDFCSGDDPVWVYPGAPVRGNRPRLGQLRRLGRLCFVRRSY